MSTTVEFQGPSMQRRVLTQKDFEGADVEFEEGYKLDDLVWEANDLRKRVVLPDDLSDSTLEQMKEVFKREGTFRVRSEGETTVEAKPGSDEVNADGSNRATGEGGSATLASTLGPDATSGGGRGSTSASTTGSSTRTSTTGGSTASS